MHALGRTIVTAFAAAALLLTSCAGLAATDSHLLPGETALADLLPIDLAAGERLRVVATTSFAAEVVRIVAGESVDLTPLLPLGADPHAYEPTPQDVRALAEADVVFINGLGLEVFLDGTLEAAGGRAVVVSLSEGIEALTFAELDDHADEGEEHAEEEGHEHGGLDPHVWLDPLNMARWADNAGAALAALDPANAEAYVQRAAGYAGELQALDAWIRAEVEPLPPEARRLVTDHDELGYFAARYGFEIVGAVIPAFSSAAEPSARELAALESLIVELGVPALFVSSAVNPALAARVARDTGTQLVTLYTHSLGAPGGPAASYIELMQYNARAIVAALR
jgi:ABC-type Zn uptake system ZnuABC Zn-binding protein ZnuA